MHTNHNVSIIGNQELTFHNNEFNIHDVTSIVLKEVNGELIIAEIVLKTNFRIIKDES